MKDNRQIMQAGGGMLPLHENKDILTQLEKFTKLLNDAPDPATLQKTPDGKAAYLPIDYVENQLREDFAGLVQFTVISERRELNEYIVHARITVMHPVAMQWLSYDGIGVTQIMQDSGATLGQFNDTKKKNALEMNAPKAYSEAIKNAAKKIGKKYGGSLNRKHEDDYTAVYSEGEAIEQAEAVLRTLQSKEAVKEFAEAHRDLMGNKEFKKKVNAKYQSL